VGAQLGKEVDFTQVALRYPGVGTQGIETPQAER
jgi:hypothetical protein